MPKGQRVTTLDISKIQEMVEKNIPLSEISQTLGISSHTISRYAPRRLPKANSLRGRVLQAIQEKGEFGTVGDIMLAIRKPNENIDLHSLTHIIRALRQQGLITFKEDKNNGKMGSFSGRGSTSSIPYAIANAKRPRPLHIIEEPPDPDETPEGETPNEATDFPIIRRLAQANNLLENAAKLAEQAGAEDIAIQLYDRLNSPMSQLEKEAIDLWHLYISGRNENG